MIVCRFENGKEVHLRHVVVDTLVLKDDRILLVKRTKEIREGGKWGLVGGYVSTDEKIKETVKREVFEETGYKVKDMKLLTIVDEPNRPNDDRQNIAFVFFCNALEKEGESDWEVDELKWFELNKLPKENDIAFDHHKFIQLYIKYLKNPFPLPIFN